MQSFHPEATVSTISDVTVLSQITIAYAIILFFTPTIVDTSLNDLTI